MTHAVVSILNEAPAKVRCRTCHNDHDFRNEQPPPPKVDPRKAALFNQVLENVTVSQPEPPAKAETIAQAEPEPAAQAAAAAADDPPPAKTKARKKSKA